MRGAKIAMPFSPLRTDRPISFHFRKPATWVASGFCSQISIWLVALYLWNLLIVLR